MDNATRLKNAAKNADKRIYRWTIDSKTFAVGVVQFQEDIQRIRRVAKQNNDQS